MPNLYIILQHIQHGQQNKWCSMKSNVSSYPFNLNNKTNISIISFFKLVPNKVLGNLLFEFFGGWNQELRISPCLRVLFSLYMEAEDPKLISQNSSLFGNLKALCIKALSKVSNTESSRIFICFVTWSYQEMHS